jgi:uncharacterized protein YkvS
MLTYIFIKYLPGSAGNFFCRCIGLVSDQCYGWIPAGTDNINLSVEDKFNVFQYKEKCKTWIDFERKLQHYSQVVPHHALPHGAVSVWQGHPCYDFLSRDITGPDDKKFVFYIDPSKNFEWCMLNCLYKNSYIDAKWLIEGKKMLDDANIVKLDLGDIIASRDTLVGCVEKVCNIAGIVLKEQNKQKIAELWDQWTLTTLPASEFQRFKTKIGYCNT